MTNAPDNSRQDWRSVPRLEEVVEETREPVEAAVIRARVDQETEERLADVAAGQQQAQNTLRENEVAIARTNDDLREVEEGVESVRQAAREVEDGISKINRGLEETARAAEWEPPKIEG
jgi:septal ring factor EnvC (AmiA/AmiB activator)